MKTFKLIDFWVSAGLIIVFTVLSIFKQDYTFIAGYFVVGAWQVISMLVHTFKRLFCEKGGPRLQYHKIVIVVLSCTLTGFLIYPLLLVMLYVLLFTAPFMAIYYTWLCYREVYVKMQRPLSVLK